MLQIMKETANIWEYKVSNNANIPKWKTQIFFVWFVQASVIAHYKYFKLNDEEGS